MQEKSYAFALNIVQVHRKLIAQKEFVIGQQLLRAGTSIGANVEEALQGQSRKDFIAKLSIALKEAHETRYWIKILRDAHLLDPETSRSLIGAVEEVIRLLTSILKTTKMRG